MDVTAILFEHAKDLLLTYGVYAVALAVLAAFFTSAWFKGKLGEFLVNMAAYFRLDHDTYHLIKDVTLPTDTGTTQIDHIIVSVYGVFVVETKYMKGWIFGAEKQKTWTQKIYRHTTRFQNPLHQNYKHVKTLQSLLDLTDEQVHSVVVFIGDSVFKTAMPANVAYGGAYISYIKSKTKPVLTSEQVSQIKQQIDQGRLERSFKTNRAHIRHVRETLNTKASVTGNITCPKCGGAMVLRESKRGATIGQQFWGCGAYPKCRAIVQV